MPITLRQFNIWILLLFSLVQMLISPAYADPKFPPLTGSVVDTAQLLAPEIKTQLEQQLAAHQQATSNQIVVAIIHDLQGYPIDDFGYQLGRAWGIGKKDKNNGVLLLVAPQEKKVRIEVGYGLEGTLTDAITTQIIHTQILPAFRQHNYQAGITQGVTAIIAALGGQYTMQEEAQPKRVKLPLWAWLIILPLLFLHRRMGLWGGYYGGGFGNSSGGGGFSGGGGSFGGGGASGGW